MPLPEKRNRNKKIIWLRRLNPEHYTTRVLAKIFGVNHVMVARIIKRDYNKYPLPDWIMGEIKRIEKELTNVNKRL